MYEKLTVSAYELDKIDVKVSIIKRNCTNTWNNVGDFVDGNENVLSSDIVQMVLLLQRMQNEELRKVAVEQVKVLENLNKDL